MLSVSWTYVYFLVCRTGTKMWQRAATPLKKSTPAQKFPAKQPVVSRANRLFHLAARRRNNAMSASMLRCWFRLHSQRFITWIRMKKTLTLGFQSTQNSIKMSKTSALALTVLKFTKREKSCRPGSPERICGTASPVPWPGQCKHSSPKVFEFFNWILRFPVSSTFYRCLLLCMSLM